MSRFASRTLRLLVALSFIPLVAEAQTRPFGSGTAIGVTIQAIRIEDDFEQLPGVGLHITAIRPSGFAVDVGLTTTLPGLGSGGLLVGSDASIGYVFPMGGGGLMVKAGPSGVFAVGEGAEVIGGVHVGAVAFLRLGNRFGIRAEVVPRFYAYEGDRIHVATFGIGFTSLPARRR